MAGLPPEPAIMAEQAMCPAAPMPVSMPPPPPAADALSAATEPDELSLETDDAGADPVEMIKRLRTRLASKAHDLHQIQHQLEEHRERSQRDRQTRVRRYQALMADVRGGGAGGSDALPGSGARSRQTTIEALLFPDAVAAPASNTPGDGLHGAVEAATAAMAAGTAAAAPPSPAPPVPLRVMIAPYPAQDALRALMGPDADPTPAELSARLTGQPVALAPTATPRSPARSPAGADGQVRRYASIVRYGATARPIEADKAAAACPGVGTASAAASLSMPPAGDVWIPPPPGLQANAPPQGTVGPLTGSSSGPASALDSNAGTHGPSASMTASLSSSPLVFDDPHGLPPLVPALPLAPPEPADRDGMRTTDALMRSIPSEGAPAPAPLEALRPRLAIDTAATRMLSPHAFSPRRARTMQLPSRTRPSLGGVFASPTPEAESDSPYAVIELTPSPDGSAAVASALSSSSASAAAAAACRPPAFRPAKRAWWACFVVVLRHAAWATAVAAVAAAITLLVAVAPIDHVRHCVGGATSASGRHVSMARRSVVAAPTAPPATAGLSPFAQHRRQRTGGSVFRIGLHTTDAPLPEPPSLFVRIWRRLTLAPSSPSVLSASAWHAALHRAAATTATAPIAGDPHVSRGHDQPDPCDRSSCPAVDLATTSSTSTDRTSRADDRALPELPSHARWPPSPARHHLVAPSVPRAARPAAADPDLARDLDSDATTADATATDAATDATTTATSAPPSRSVSSSFLFHATPHLPSPPPPLQPRHDPAVRRYVLAPAEYYGADFSPPPDLSPVDVGGDPVSPPPLPYLAADGGSNVASLWPVDGAVAAGAAAVHATGATTGAGGMMGHVDALAPTNSVGKAPQHGSSMFLSTLSYLVNRRGTVARPRRTLNSASSSSDLLSSTGLPRLDHHMGPPPRLSELEAPASSSNLCSTSTTTGSPAQLAPGGPKIGHWTQNLTSQSSSLDYSDYFHDALRDRCGVWLFRIDALKPMAVSARDAVHYGKFCVGDCYIVLHTYRKGQRQTLAAPRPRPRPRRPVRASRSETTSAALATASSRRASRAASTTDMLAGLPRSTTLRSHRSLQSQESLDRPLSRVSSGHPSLQSLTALPTVTSPTALAPAGGALLAAGLTRSTSASSAALAHPQQAATSPLAGSVSTSALNDDASGRTSAAASATPLGSVDSLAGESTADTADSDDGDAARQHELYIWIGSESELDKRFCCAMYAVGLRNWLRLDCRVERETEGDESDEFLALFPDFAYLDASQAAESGLFITAAKRYPRRLYQLDGKRQIFFRLVEPDARSLASSHVYLYDVGMAIFIWQGRDASLSHRRQARMLGERLNKLERVGRASLEVLDEGHESASLMERLPNWSLRPAVAPVAEQVEDEAEPTETETIPAEQAETTDPTARLLADLAAQPVLYRASLSLADDLETHLVGRGTLLRAQLQSDQTYVLDGGTELFIWLGKRAEPERRLAAQELLARLVERTPRPPWVGLHKLVEHCESEFFKWKFKDWDNATAGGGARAPAAIADAAATAARDAPIRVDVRALFRPSPSLSYAPVSREIIATAAAHASALLTSMAAFVYARGRFVPLPDAERGHFFTDDAYLFLCVYQRDGATVGGSAFGGTSASTASAPRSFPLRRCRTDRRPSTGLTPLESTSSTTLESAPSSASASASSVAPTTPSRAASTTPTTTATTSATSPSAHPSARRKRRSGTKTMDAARLGCATVPENSDLLRLADDSLFSDSARSSPRHSRARRLSEDADEVDVAEDAASVAAASASVGAAAPAAEAKPAVECVVYFWQGPYVSRLAASTFKFTTQAEMRTLMRHMYGCDPLVVDVSHGHEPLALLAHLGSQVVVHRGARQTLMDATARVASAVSPRSASPSPSPSPSPLASPLLSVSSAPSTAPPPLTAPLLGRPTRPPPVTPAEAAAVAALQRPRMYQIRSDAHHGATRAIEVDADAEALLSTDCYMVADPRGTTNNRRHWLWVGQHVRKDDVKQAHRVAVRLVMFLDPIVAPAVAHASAHAVAGDGSAVSVLSPASPASHDTGVEPHVRIVAEKMEPASFWAALGVARGPHGTAIPSSPLPVPALDAPPRVFVCSCANGYFSVDELLYASQRSLRPDACVIIDPGFPCKVYCWVGSEASDVVCKLTRKAVDVYLENLDDGRLAHVVVGETSRPGSPVSAAALAAAAPADDQIVPRITVSTATAAATATSGAIPPAPPLPPAAPLAASFRARLAPPACRLAAMPGVDPRSDVVYVAAGAEPVALRALFHGWDPRAVAGGLRGGDPGNAFTRQRAAELSAKRAAAGAMPASAASAARSPSPSPAVAPSVVSVAAVRSLS